MYDEESFEGFNIDASHFLYVVKSVLHGISVNKQSFGGVCGFHIRIAKRKEGGSITLCDEGIQVVLDVFKAFGIEFVKVKKGFFKRECATRQLV